MLDISFDKTLVFCLDGEELVYTFYSISKKSVRLKEEAENQNKKMLHPTHLTEDIREILNLSCYLLLCLIKCNQISKQDVFFIIDTYTFFVVLIILKVLIVFGFSSKHPACGILQFIKLKGWIYMWLTSDLQLNST